MTEIPNPLPVHADYEAATAFCSEEFQLVGGPWVVAYREEFASRSMRAKRDLVGYAGLIGRKLEPIDEEGRAYDPLLKVTHAFKHGLLFGMKITDIVHGPILKHAGPLECIGNYINIGKTGHTSETDQEHIEFLINAGEDGLAVAGDRAAEHIDHWGDDIVSDDRVQRLFRLGCGVIICTAYNIQKAYDDAQIDAMVSDPNWLREL